MLTLSQRLSQQQKLSPQQIQYQKLLQLNTIALEQRIKTELEMNPILEEVMEEEAELSLDTDEKDNSDEISEEEEISDSSKDEFELEDFMNDSEYEYDSDKLNKSNDDEVYQPLARAKESLSEHLREQLRMLNLDEDMYLLGEEIIGNLDSDGYLKSDLLEIIKELEVFEHTTISPESAEALLKKIQRFDPIGIASRTLQECLLVQLRNIAFDPYYSYLAEELLEKYFNDFTQKRYDVIKQKMSLTDDGLKATIELIQSLNPKPGEGNIESVEMNQITPDFLIEKVDNNFVINT
jgi:RNA polymerase sigma-54 factor